MPLDFGTTMEMFQGIPEGIMVEGVGDETPGGEQGDGAVDEDATSSIRIDVRDGRLVTSVTNVSQADCATLLLCLSKIELELIRKMRNA
ncbi:MULTISPECIES: hypothetical protein [unclassified Burkholderia]|uniref:hypothetical protein n=1 Tax=unclassified Burkholderia TaxID=2613784 RepID=UPI002ABE1B64|nr:MULTISPECIES: hypothetical protein [unclassified Burkholderia]